jgi:hypothetical protein
MVYNIQSYWAFGFCPSSGMLKTIERNFSETGLFPPSGKSETPTLLSPLEKDNIDH